MARGLATRPTPARVREALFSALGARVEAGTVLDLFAGSGSLGIEALSRGARAATFVEPDRGAAVILRQNLAVLGAQAAAATVLPLTAERALIRLRGRGAPFDLIFFDPPYAMYPDGRATAALAALHAGGLLAPGGIVVCEHPGRGAGPTPPAGWQAVWHRAYGDVALTLLGAPASATPDPDLNADTEHDIGSDMDVTR